MSEVHATRLVCINQKMCSFYIGALIISAFAIALLVQLKYARAAYRHNTYTMKTPLHIQIISSHVNVQLTRWICQHPLANYIIWNTAYNIRTDFRNLMHAQLFTQLQHIRWKYEQEK